MEHDVETLAAKFHDIYQEEARRQGDVRHADAYDDLSEDIKEFDRVLARYVLAEVERLRAALNRAGDRLAQVQPAVTESWAYDIVPKAEQEIAEALRGGGK